MNLHFAQACLRESTRGRRAWADTPRIRPTPVFALLLLAALVLPPLTRGASATVQLSGTWTTVHDTGSVLDGSIGVGSNYVATYSFMGVNGAGSGQYLEFDGTIDRIVLGTLPQFTRIAVSGTDLNLSGSNVLAGSYVLVVSTNLIAAPAQWTAILTNTFGGETGFNVTATNEFSTNRTAKFYRYRTP